MASWAKVGAKVVCIDAGIIDRSYAGFEPGEEVFVGQVYTVVDVFNSPTGALTFSLAEVRRLDSAQAYWGGASGYGAWRFRPLITKTQEQDVAMFKSILVSAPLHA